MFSRFWQFSHSGKLALLRKWTRNAARETANIRGVLSGWFGYPKALASTIVTTLLVILVSFATIFIRPKESSFAPAESLATKVTDSQINEVSNASPVLDSNEANAFAEAMLKLRQRIEEVNEPSIFSTDSVLNDNEPQTLPSLQQRLDRLQGNIQSESQSNQSGDER